jgi:hypothetical protein
MLGLNLEPLIQQIKLFTQAQIETNKLLLEIRDLLKPKK